MLQFDKKHKLSRKDKNILNLHRISDSRFYEFRKAFAMKYECQEQS